MMYIQYKFRDCKKNKGSEHSIPRV